MATINEINANLSWGILAVAGSEEECRWCQGSMLLFEPGDILCNRHLDEAYDVLWDEHGIEARFADISPGGKPLAHGIKGKHLYKPRGG